VTELLERLRGPLQDRYALEREIGRGGMATVFLARDRKHDRLVAVKVLAPEIAAAVGVERFTREIRIAANLSHPHIVPLHDSGEVAGLLYFVMPFIPGESLRGRLDRERQLSIEDAVRIAREAGDALDHAQSLGVVHRDIKPENILLSRGHAVIADFGVAKAVAAAGDEAITRTGSTVGSPVYMSPEQASGTHVDVRSDIYALGCVLYEMLAGIPPFTGPTAAAILARKLTEPLPRLSVLRETVPRRLEQLVERCLARIPADRFQTALALVEAIDTLAKPSDVETIGGTSSIAVLPFVNMSADPENEYFSDGISEELINVLAQVPGLRVAARTSSFAFKGRNLHVRTIADQLGVSAVLEGSVRRVGDRVRVTGQLVSTPDGYQVWSESYDRRIEDVFAIQDEIAAAIAATLRVKLLGRGVATRPRSPDPEAYQYYLKGRHLWNLDNTNAGRALEWFQKAVERDSQYALPYAGMADCYCTIGAFQLAPQQRIRELGIAAARRALELDEGSPQVRFSSGYVKFYMEWDWAEAEREFKRAVELNPNYEQPCLFLGLLLAAQGRFGEAEEWAARGRAADPVSGFAHFIGAMPAYFAHDWERAIRGYEEALELTPSLANPLWTLSVSQSYAGYHDEAIATGERLASLSQRAPAFLGTLGTIYVRAGRMAEARGIEAELERRSAAEYVTPYITGIFKGWLGKVDEAFELLNQAYEERNTLMWVMARDAQTDPVRGDPRFDRLLSKLGLQLDARA
jgi:eukaryotic-like serine/threonine-protein kinase